MRERKGKIRHQLKPKEAREAKYNDSESVDEQLSLTEEQTVTYPCKDSITESVLLLSVKPLRSNSEGGERTFLTAAPCSSAN